MAAAPPDFDPIGLAEFIHIFNSWVPDCRQLSSARSSPLEKGIMQMRINYPAEFRLRVQNELEVEFLRSPQGKGRFLPSSWRQDGSVIFADNEIEDFVTFMEERGVPVVHID